MNFLMLTEIISAKRYDLEMADVKPKISRRNSVEVVHVSDEKNQQLQFLIKFKKVSFDYKIFNIFCKKCMRRNLKIQAQHPLFLFVKFLKQ